jgi:hypothetical protein
LTGVVPAFGVWHLCGVHAGAVVQVRLVIESRWSQFASECQRL